MNAVINKWKNKSQNNRYIIIDKILFLVTGSVLAPLL